MTFASTPFQIGVMIGTELARERFAKSGKKDGGHIINIASVAGEGSFVVGETQYVRNLGVYIHKCVTLNCCQAWSPLHSVLTAPVTLWPSMVLSH